MNILFNFLIFFFFVQCNSFENDSLNDKFYSFMWSIVDSPYVSFLNEQAKNEYNETIQKNSDVLTISVDEVKFSKPNSANISIKIPVKSIVTLIETPRHAIKLNYEEKIESFLEQIMKKLYELNLKRFLLFKIENVLNNCKSNLYKEKNTSTFEYYKQKIDYFSEIVLSVKEDTEALEDELKRYLGRKICFFKIKYKEIILFFKQSFSSKVLQIEKMNSEIYGLNNKYTTFLSIISPVIVIPCQSNKKIFMNLEINLLKFIKFFNLNSEIKLRKMKHDFKVLEISFSLGAQKRNIQHKINMLNIKREQLKSYKKIINANTTDLSKVPMNIKLNYLEDYLNYFSDFVDLVLQIILYKKNNGDLIHNYRQIVIRRVHGR